MSFSYRTSSSAKDTSSINSFYPFRYCREESNPNIKDVIEKNRETTLPHSVITTLNGGLRDLEVLGDKDPEDLV